MHVCEVMYGLKRASFYKAMPCTSQLKIISVSVLVPIDISIYTAAGRLQILTWLGSDLKREHSQRQTQHVQAVEEINQVPLRQQL